MTFMNLSEVQLLRSKYIFLPFDYQVSRLDEKLKTTLSGKTWDLSIFMDSIILLPLYIFQPVFEYNWDIFKSTDWMELYVSV